jgi:hypothetical protein
MVSEFGVSFSGLGRHFIKSEIARIDHSLVGVFAVYHIVKVGGIDDFRPVLWGYGRIRKGLEGALQNASLTTLPVLQFNYIDNIAPDRIQGEYERLREAFPPNRP